MYIKVANYFANLFSFFNLLHVSSSHAHHTLLCGAPHRIPPSLEDPETPRHTVTCQLQCYTPLSSTNKNQPSIHHPSTLNHLCRKSTFQRSRSCHFSPSYWIHVTSWVQSLFPLDHVARSPWLPCRFLNINKK